MPSATFRPDWASAPGDTIGDLLRERSMSRSDFALAMGMPPSDAVALLDGHAMMTIGLARQLTSVVGGSVEFWVSRDYQFRESARQFDEEHRRWLDGLPISHMIKYGWLLPAPRPQDELQACLGFFGVPSVEAWKEVYAAPQTMAAFRISPTLDSRPGAIAAWLRQGELQAPTAHCEPWDRSGLEAKLPELRSLTRVSDPRRFLPTLQALCAQVGVAVAVVRTPPGCPASGATKFISDSCGLVLLSFRFLTDDHFWFTLFHELGHLVLHGSSHLFLESPDMPLTEEELEANEFATKVLIPSDAISDFHRLPLRYDDIIRFAVDIGVSPGIVVGQLQNAGRIKYSQFNKLKRRYQWST